MTPTPRSRAGSSVTSLPCRMMRPVSGSSRPAMMRRMVVLPLPDAPSNTSDSPSATSKSMSSKTTVPLNFLLTARTDAAGSLRDESSSRRTQSPAWLRCMDEDSSGSISQISSFSVQPITREKEQTEDSEREQRKHDGNGVGRFDLPLVELREDVERRGLSLQREVAGDENGRAELADGARERQQRARHDGAAKRGQRDMPEGLPARRADGCRSLFERAAHRVEDGFDDAEGERERDEEIRHDDGIAGEHQAHAVRFQQSSQSPLRPPQEQESEACDCGRNRCRQRDSDDQGVASPEVVARQHVSGEESEDDIENRGPETRRQ